MDRYVVIDDKFEKVIFLDIDGVLNDDGSNMENGVIIDRRFSKNLKSVYSHNSVIEAVPNEKIGSYWTKRRHISPTRK